jgi:hypothetical protein
MKHFNHARWGVVFALLFTLIVPVLTAQGTTPSPATGVNVAGEWTIYLGLRQPAMFRGSLVQEGTKLSGFMGNETAEYPLTGSVQGDQMKFSWAIFEGGEKIVIAVTGKFDKEAIAGTATIGELEDIEVTGQRTSKT